MVLKSHDYCYGETEGCGKSHWNWGLQSPKSRVLKLLGFLNRRVKEISDIWNDFITFFEGLQHNRTASNDLEWKHAAGPLAIPPRPTSSSTMLLHPTPPHHPCCVASTMCASSAMLLHPTPPHQPCCVASTTCASSTMLYYTPTPPHATNVCSACTTAVYTPWSNYKLS